ncbi:FkbM family methyltransferase [Phyllobacterium sp. 1468]|nr:FkbM family methyltransferase [Phyllobacterium sp. 1468]
MFAFEPSPVASNVIASTIKDNRLRTITLTVAAVGDKDGTERIFMPVGDVVHSPSAFFSDPAFEPLEVPLIRLDTFKAMSGRTLDAIKVDVEGYEPNVIRGLQQMSSKGLIRNLIIEFNSGWLRRNESTPQDLFDLIVSFGFVVHRKTEISQGPGRDGTSFECQDMWFKWRQ